jgi:hypothetical protein
LVSKAALAQAWIRICDADSQLQEKDYSSRGRANAIADKVMRLTRSIVLDNLTFAYYEASPRGYLQIRFDKPCGRISRHCECTGPVRHLRWKKVFEKSPLRRRQARGRPRMPELFRFCQSADPVIKCSDPREDPLNTEELANFSISCGFTYVVPWRLFPHEQTVDQSFIFHRERSQTFRRVCTWTTTAFDCFPVEFKTSVCYSIHHTVP